VSARPAKPAAPRRRRSAPEAREAILEAAEKALREVGPGGIRLQEVAAAVGVSHSTVLHHFKSREGLLEAVVARALQTVQAGLFDAVKQPVTQPASARVEALLEQVAAQLKDNDRGRTFLWLALEGYGTGLKALQLRPLAEAVHEVRRGMRAGKKRMPPFEDTWFSVVLPALALLSLSALEAQGGGDFDVPRFRAWLARLIHEHLQAE
jgi:AcrR family transcriptional regulator